MANAYHYNKEAISISTMAILLVTLMADAYYLDKEAIGISTMAIPLVTLMTDTTPNQ